MRMDQQKGQYDCEDYYFVLEVPGRPVPYTRMTQKSKFVSKAAKRYLDYKQVVGILAHNKMKGKKIIEGPCNIEVTVYLYGKNTDMGMDGDTSNYLKSAEDSLNKIVYLDDRQIWGCKANKFPAAHQKDEKLIIKIKEIKGIY